MNNIWWHDNLTTLANQLSVGVLNEMKHRITTSNIQKEKLQLNEDTPRIKAFFEREIKRYNHRKESMRLKNQSTDKYRDVIRALLIYNQSLATKCQEHDIAIDKVPLFSTIYSWK